MSAANAEALRLFVESDPVLVDIRPAIEVVPGMTASTILTSGPPLAADEYTGGQRRAVLYGAVYEGLAGDVEDAERKVAAGEITVSHCHGHGCVGSVAGLPPELSTHKGRYLRKTGYGRKRPR